MTYTVALIPARFYSTGVEHKNIRMLSGHPMLAYSIKAGLNTWNIDRVIVSTDSPEYAAIAKRYGAEVPFLRPSALASANASDYGFIAHAIDWIDENENKVPDLIVHLRPTTPLRDTSLLVKAVAALRVDSEATALRSVHEMHESAYKCFEIAAQKLKTITGSCEIDLASQSRQMYPKTYQANGYVDVLKTTFIRAHKHIHGDHVLAFITPPVVEVDTEEDFSLVEYQVARNPAIINQLFIN